MLGLCFEQNKLKYRFVVAPGDKRDTPEAVASAYGVDVSEVVSIIAFEPGNAIKINMRRRLPSGDPGETDVFGAQQYAPLLDLEVPDDAP